MKHRVLKMRCLGFATEPRPFLAAVLSMASRRTWIGYCLSACLGAMAALHSPVITAQSDSQTPPNVSATVAALLLMFPSESEDQASDITLPDKVVVLGLADVETKTQIEQRLLDGLENQNVNVLADLVMEYFLSIDISQSTETTLALQSTVAGNPEEQLGLHVQNKDFEAVEAMLEQGLVDVNVAVKINDLDFLPFTPLIRAASNRDMKTAELLLSYGADPDATGDESVLTALGHAVMSHNLEFTRALLKAGASADFNHNVIGREPLAVWAAQIDDLSLMKLLIDHGVDPAQASNRGWTPLTEAIRLKHFGMAQFLVAQNDPRVLTESADSTTFDGRFDGQYFPQSNALHLARHFLEPAQSEVLIPRILDRARMLGGDSAVSLLELQARKSSSQLAYAELDTAEAGRQRQLAFDTVDVLALDSDSDEALITGSMSMLINLHELQVVEGKPFSQKNRLRAAHIATLNSGYVKWHDMLDIMAAAKTSDVSALIAAWRGEHGDPAQPGWNYEMLLSWVDEDIEDRNDRARLYETIDVFRSVNVFQ